MATINDVRLDRPVEFMPYVAISGHSRPIDANPVILSAAESGTLIASISRAGQLNVIEDTLQGLCERNNGTKLKTAFPSLTEFKDALQMLSPVPLNLVQTLDQWAQLGCNEVDIHFEEKVCG